jgi:glycosyltransferase involved in cell wall biosynthesis
VADRAARPADVALVAKREAVMTGTRRYAGNLESALRAQGVDVARGEPVGFPGAAAVPFVGPRLRAFFDTYPLGLRAPRAAVLHLTMESLATALLTARPRVPVVVTVHDVISYMTRRDPVLRGYAHPLHELFDLVSLRLLRRATLLIADAEWTAHALVAHGGCARELIRVVPLGVDHGRFRVTAPSHPVVEEALAGAGDAPIVGFVGALVARKNLGALLEAMPIIRARVPGTRLVAAGPGTPAAAARARGLVAELGLIDAVTLLGNVPDDAVPALYRRATVVVVPSLYEGFGLPALEAMACGAPVVAAARASLPEVVADAGVLCQPEPAAIAAAVGDLLLEPARRERVAAAGVERARGFTWERTARLTRAVYEEAVALSARPSRA